MRMDKKNRLMTHSWGQKVVRFYDPDGNLIEVGDKGEEHAANSYVSGENAAPPRYAADLEEGYD